MGHVRLPCLPVEQEEVKEEQREHQPAEDQPRPEGDARRTTHAHIPFTRISHLDLAPPMIQTLLSLPY
jgi:hypothetical protein